MSTLKIAAGLALVIAAGAGAWMKFGSCGSCSLSQSAATPKITTVAINNHAAPVVNTAGTAVAAAATALASPGKHFQVDPVHSAVIYGIKHLNVSNNYGRFNQMSGTFHIDPADLSGSSIDIKVMTDSVDSANSDRDKHLRSADFFSSKEFPEMTFKSTSFANKADNTFDVTGELNFMGKAKTITVPVTFTGKGPGMRGGEVAGFETRFTIKRSEFGMDKMLNNLSDDVSLIIAFEGSR